jgi:hypothetical protein
MSRYTHPLARFVYFVCAQQQDDQGGRCGQERGRYETQFSGWERVREFAQTLLEFGIVSFVVALYQALRSASVSLVAPSTLVMRLRL